MIGWTSTPLAGGGRGAGADHASANMIPTNLIMMKGAQVGQGLESSHLQSRYFFFKGNFNQIQNFRLTVKYLKFGDGDGPNLCRAKK